MGKDRPPHAAGQPPPPPKQRPAADGGGQNPSLAGQQRKVLGKHYANKYGKRRGG